MRRRSKTSKETVKTRRRRTVKRRSTAKTVVRRTAVSHETTNAQLVRERDEALEQLSAASKVLKVISSSPGELKPVFDAIVANAARLCDATFSAVAQFDGEQLHLVAVNKMSPEETAAYHSLFPRRPNRTFIMGRAFVDGKPVHVEDIETDPDYDPHTFSVLRAAAPYRTYLGIPILRDGVPIGVIGCGRREVRPFTEAQIALVKAFAAQAVIAIENTRLLNELRESLEQQTTTSDILAVVSNSLSDTQPVFDAIVESGVRLFPGAAVSIALVENGVVKAAAVAEHDPVRAELWRRRFPFPLTREYMHSVAILDRKMLDIPNVEDAPAEMEVGRKNFLGSGYRAATFMPLMRGEMAIGALSVVRTDPGPMSEKQLAALKTYAAQAVIAIENTRLLNELRKSLEHQTATSEVLNVISRSTTNAQPVFEAIAESAARLCDGVFTVVWLYDGDLLHYASSHNFTPEVLDQIKKTFPKRPDRSLAAGRAILDRKIAHVSDMLADPAYAHEMALAGNWRASIAVPMLRDGGAVGAISVGKAEAGPFTERQMQLLTTFADQAVIAIENVRLFDDVQKRTQELSESLEQQIATAEVLKVISRSTFDLQTVLQTLVESATRLCDAEKGTITRQKGDHFYRAETYGFSSEFMDSVSNVPVVPDRSSATARALLEGKVVHIPDVHADPEYTFSEALKHGEFRTILGVPMMREGVPIGVFALTRADVRPFSEKQIELVSTFADQAAIAIENVRLFEDVQKRTEELSASLHELRTAQDRLVQTEKLASLGQLTAGIAHEIKNPLNFVNNFSSVSTELIDDLNEILATVKTDDKTRADIAELADALRGNLDKIVQHGKRADSIVKNMLLHSREGSGEHRPVDVNALVEESLNLAYHGARTEKQGFNITLERSFDPDAGEVDLYPQEVTRVLLNLISNGFYAAIKRKNQAGNEGFEPILAAATKSLGDRVEIRIRDNGTGIPPDVRAKMFNPFFTTKPAGEGTGLGLSLSYDIIVKQHSGSIEVDTQLGAFTEFRIVLPRGAGTIAKSGGRA